MNRLELGATIVSIIGDVSIFVGVVVAIWQLLQTRPSRQT
jgi:hypothetical protein